MNHDVRSNKFKLFCSALVLLALFLLMYLFVYLQFDVVANATQFWTVVSVLIFASFWSSAMEAALSTLVGTDNEFSLQAEQEMAEHFESYGEFKELNGEEVEKSHVKAFKAFERKKKKLKAIHRLSSGIDRTEIVGAFAALSVFLNVSVGVFLPLTMIDGQPSEIVFSVPERLTSFINEVQDLFALQETYCFASRTWFVFTASSLPVLLLGKIVPKAIGLQYSIFWISTFKRPALFVQKVFGWVSLGTTWFLIKKK